MITLKRILVIQTSFIGDAILATSVLESLHASQPEARIDMLVKKGNEALFLGHPFIGKVLIWDKTKSKYSSLFQLILQVRKEAYDGVINLHRFASSGLLTALSGAKHTAGFTKNPLHHFFKYTAPHPMLGEHEVERNFFLIKPLVQSETPVLPCLYPSAADEAKVSTLKASPYRCMAPTSVWFTKQWPKAHWISLIKLIPADEIIYLLGAAADAGYNDSIIAESNRQNIVNLAGKLNLLQSAALMRDALMNYVNDSAPLHLCSAMKAPVKVIFCSTVPSFGFGPLGNKAKSVEINVPLTCRPCGLHGHKRCPEQHFKCGLDVSPQTVWNA